MYEFQREQIFMKIKYFFIPVLLVLAAAAPVFSMTAEEAMGKFRARMNIQEPISGVISWTMSDDVQCTGSFKYMPGKFYLKFTNPAGRIIVCNGKKLWIYSQSSNVVGIQTLSDKQSGGLVSLLYGYTGIVTQDGDGYTVKLKKDDAYYPEAVLSLDSTFFLKRLVIKDKKGNVQRFSISSIETGSVMKNHFEFSVPANAQVLKNPLDIQ